MLGGAAGRPRSAVLESPESRPKEPTRQGGPREDSQPVQREWRLGYVLDRRHWGHGYMAEAAHALVAVGFGHLALRRIWATCDIDNHASARVLEKVGLRRDGLLRQNVRRKGEWRDSYLSRLGQ